MKFLNTITIYAYTFYELHFGICMLKALLFVSLYISFSNSGFSAICVTIWGILMHLIVDLQLLESKEDKNEDIYSTSTNETIDLENNSTTYPFLNVSTDPATTAEPSKAPPKSYDRCWKGYSNYNLLWIITGPMTLVLLVSLHLYNFVPIKYVLNLYILLRWIFIIFHVTHFYRFSSILFSWLILFELW